MATLAPSVLSILQPKWLQRWMGLPSLTLPGSPLLRPRPHLQFPSPGLGPLPLGLALTHMPSLLHECFLCPLY